MSRGVGRIVKKQWKIVGGHRRYVGIDAKGRWKFLKHPKSSRSSSKKSRTKSKKRSVKKTARRKRRRRNPKTIPVAPVIGLVAQSWPAIERARRGQWYNMVGELKSSFLGINPSSNKFELDRLLMGYAPTIAGVLVHKFVGGWPLNVNRMLGRAGVPLIRI